MFCVPTAPIIGVNISEWGEVSIARISQAIVKGISYVTHYMYKYVPMVNSRVCLEAGEERDHK